MPIAYNLGLGTTIVQLLRQYGKVSTDFLADKLNHTRAEIDEYLALLQQDGAVLREEDLVGLVPERK
jgi:DeoR/GlpR family transcriptional regulator of sugar metabolism